MGKKRVVWMTGFQSLPGFRCKHCPSANCFLFVSSRRLFSGSHIVQTFSASFFLVPLFFSPFLPRTVRGPSTVTC